MSGWPLVARIAVVAVPFAATVAAFANGWMVLAVIGVAASGWAFQRAFLSGI